ncbi:MAG: CBS domain-containing protein [Deltaproteobacteria bacterium]|nr:CBS domain-containing protein [Deltaproteobacteria bacterium]
MPLKTLGSIHGTRPIISTTTTTNLQEAAKLMEEKGVGALPVVDDRGQLVGILSERDIVRRGVALMCNLCKITVGEIMTRKVCVGEPSEDYRLGLAKMQNMHCRHLPIVAGQKLVGIVSMRDLLTQQIDEYAFDVQMLEKYITS